MSVAGVPIAAKPVAPAEKVWLLVILAAALLFVAWSPGSYVLQMDTAELSAMGQDIAQGKRWPLTGANVASGAAGRWAGPLVYYLASLPFWFTTSLQAGAVFFGLLLVVATGLLWQSTRVLFGPQVALAAAALYGCGAHVALEQRLNFFTALAPLGVVALLRACVAWGPQGRPQAVFWVVALLGGLVQLHVVHVAFGCLALMTWWLWRPAVPRFPLAAGLTLVALMQLPWLVEQLQSGGADWHKAVGWLGQRKQAGSAFSAAATLQTLTNALIAPIRLPLAVVQAQEQALMPWHWALAGLLAILQLAALALTPWRGPWRSGLLLLAVWLAVPIALFLVGRDGIYSFHLVAVLPAFAAMAGLGAVQLANRVGVVLGGTWAKTGLAVLVAVHGLLSAVLLQDIAAAANRRGDLHYPMAAVLSFPDALWRFPVQVHFATLASADQLRTLLARHGLSDTTPGQVHGQPAMALSFYPPLLPVCQTAKPDHKIATPWRLDRVPDCPVAADREGPWCLSPLPEPNLLQDWTVGWRDGRSLPGCFPAHARAGTRWTRSLPAGGRWRLRVQTLGPTAIRMDRLQPPAIVVKLGDVAVEPEAFSVSAPFWVAAERTYTLATDRPTIVTVASGEKARHVIDLTLESLPLPPSVSATANQPL